MNCKFLLFDRIKTDYIVLSCFPYRSTIMLSNRFPENSIIKVYKLRSFYYTSDVVMEARESSGLSFIGM